MTITDEQRNLAREIRAFVFEWINLTSRHLSWDVLDSKIAKMIADSGFERKVRLGAQQEMRDDEAVTEEHLAREWIDTWLTMPGAIPSNATAREEALVELLRKVRLEEMDK